MERTVRTQRTLSKQEEMDEGDEGGCGGGCDEGGGACCPTSPEDEDSSGGMGCCNGKRKSGTEDSEEGGRSGSPPLHNSSSPSSHHHSHPPQPPSSATQAVAAVTNHNNNLLHRSRSQSKVKLLVRSEAVREETSPPREASGSPPPPPPPSQRPPPHRHKLRREGSSQGSTDSSWEPTLSRGNSREMYDSNGGATIDLQQFIMETLNRNYKDRMLLLKIETELLNLAKDSKRTAHKFGQMSSYQRMLVHRVAAYFGMEHNVDPTGASVIVNTTKTMRIPERRFKEMIRADLAPPSNSSSNQQQLSQQQQMNNIQANQKNKEDLLLPEEPRKSILKRDSSSFDETGCFKSGERMLNGDSRRSKSFEEREEEYEKARRRIFNRDHMGDGEVDCVDDLNWEGETTVCTCDRATNHHPADRGIRLLKVESYEEGGQRSSQLRLTVAKSHSFNGYDPSTGAGQQSRILTKQDSGSSMSSRISPSSSGYKSQRSDATLSATPSPTATPNLHTQTGQPYTNPDGTIYHFDPSNPPRVVENSSGGSGAGGIIGSGDSSVAMRVGGGKGSGGGEWWGGSNGGRGRGRKQRRGGGNNPNGAVRQTQTCLPLSLPLSVSYQQPQQQGVGGIQLSTQLYPIAHPVSTYYPEERFQLAPPSQPIEMKTVVYAVNEAGTTYFFAAPPAPAPLPDYSEFYWPSQQPTPPLPCTLPTLCEYPPPPLATFY